MITHVPSVTQRMVNFLLLYFLLRNIFDRSENFACFLRRVYLYLQNNYSHNYYKYLIQLL